MKKIELLEKVKQLEGLTNEEKSYLINLINTKKKYGLVWEDKPEEVEEQLRTKLPVLKEVKERGIINDTKEESYPNHILIEGDNLHALTALTFTHEGKIDVIYIDPPYNTGARDWKYDNNFVDNNDGWRHSKWINFMYHRLVIAKKLLTTDGALVCAIDHNEQENLGLLLKEIFPSKEITCVTVVHNPRGIQGDNFSYTHEFAYFVYPKGKFISRISRNEEDLEWSNLRNWGGESERKDGKSLFYPIYFKNGEIVDIGSAPEDDIHPSSPYRIFDDGLIEIWPIDNNGIERKWRYSADSLKLITDKIRIIEINGILQVQIIKDEDRPKTVWTDKKYDANVYGTQLLSKIIKTKFPFPKSLYTVKDCIKAVLGNKKQAIILDYFAGSGTTGQAVLEMNEADNGRRQFILSTNNESEICTDVTYPRIHNCINGYTFNGNIKEVLYEKKITLSFLKKSTKVLSDIDKLKQSISPKYDTTKLEINSGKLIFYGLKKINGFKDGMRKNNLRYYKCDFVDREPSLSNKRKLTRLATELLCIKEDTYHECTSQVIAENQDWIKFFNDHNSQYLSIIYDDLKIEQAVGLLQSLIEREKPDKKIKVYVFSNGQYPYTEDFEEVLDYITLSALPDAIYKAYQNVLPKKQKMLIPELEEPSSEETEKALETGELDLFNQPEEE